MKYEVPMLEQIHLAVISLFYLEMYVEKGNFKHTSAVLSRTFHSFVMQSV